MGSPHSIPGKRRFFSFPQSPDRVSSLLSNGSGSDFAGDKGVGREANHSTPPTAEVKNACSCTSIPYMSSWFSVKLFKHRDNFICFTYFYTLTISSF
jgi:hypothetical protein